jgi:3-hydroxyacyl-[acyl-carrier-protein] dehydratase
VPTPPSLSTDLPDDLVDLLPHRAPFRFVDAVDACDPGRAVTARWRIAGDEPWLAGHFPGRPVVPGVLQLEALAQAGAVAVLAHPDHAGRLPLFGGVEDARFRRQVLPGDELVLEVELDRLGSRGGWGRARATVDGAEACRARLLFVLADDR